MKSLQQGEPVSTSSRPKITYRFHASPADRPLPSPQRQHDAHISPKVDATVDATVTIMLTLAQLDPTQLAPLNRGERYQTILAHADRQRTELMTWLATEGLSSGVRQISEPNTFNILFICCTAEVAERLKQAPSVIEAAVTES